jgi:hypothetical protein
MAAPMADREYDRDDYEERAEAKRERRALYRATHCQCGDDMPGRCPGPAACPLCELEIEDEDDEEGRADD